MRSINLPWSDNWWIEDNKAWFCAGNIGALFCADMNSHECELIARIPCCEFNNFRSYSYCIKYNNLVFCFPNVEQCIWYYDIGKACWRKIDINKEKQSLMCMNIYGTHTDRVWLLEDEVGRVFEVDLKEKVVVKEDQLPIGRSSFNANECILVGESLYCVSGHTIYCIKNDIVHTYDVIGVTTDLCTICYDGTNFWLSGYCKEIYIWNLECGVIKVIREFPKPFGFYHFKEGEIPFVDYDSFYCEDFPFYFASIVLGEYIWYIPFRSDEIIYIDKKNYEVHMLEIDGEQETKESIANRALQHKYLLQYVYQDRFIGIYSLKNGWIFEVDSVELCVRRKNYKLGGEAVLAIAKADKSYYGQKLFRENRKKDSILFSALLGANAEKQKEDFLDIGKFIYHVLD